MGGAKKKPAAVAANRSIGRTKGNTDDAALAKALSKWATKLNFISYTIDRCLSSIKCSHTAAPCCQVCTAL